MNTEFRFDVRIRQRMLDKGLITAEQVDQHEKALPDLEQHCEVIALEQPARVAAERDRA
jgi:hypothetical protein